MSLTVPPAAVADEPPAPLPAQDLGLRDYLQQVVDRNLGVIGQRLEHQARVWQVRREWAAFEPELVTSAEHRRTERENNTEQALNQSSSLFAERRDGLKSGVEGLLPMGTQYRVGVTWDRIANNLTRTTTADRWEDEYQAFTGISLTQPLLRNFGPQATLARIHMAAADAEVARQELRKQLMALVGRAEAAYWDTAYAQEDLATRLESAGRAERILRDNRERVQAGKMSELEIFEAEAGLAQREALAREAEQNLAAAVNQLRTFLSASCAEQPAPIRATDTPEESPTDGDRAASLTRAMTLHPDYLAQRQTIEQENVRLAFARNQRWPQLDLVASYGLNGLGDTTGGAAADISSSDFEAWSVALELRVPLGGGQRARSELETARLRKQKAILELKSIEVELANALDTVRGRLQAVRGLIAGYGKVAEFREKTLAAEMARLDGGKSDSRKVLQAEQDLVEARLMKLKSLVDLQKARIDLELTEGAILEKLGFEPVLDDDAGGGPASL